MVRICIIIPYFGIWPEWLPLYLDSCQRNGTIDWLIFTDCPTPECVPANVRVIAVSWHECARHIQQVCNLTGPPEKPYKLCDFRFAYGHIFEKYIAGYDFWGFGDIDVIYGDLRRFLPPEIFQHDLLTFNERHVSGHLTFLRNSNPINLMYQTSTKWRERVTENDNQFLDEENGHYGIENVYFIESYNTPLSPYIPWVEGEFVFPAVWYYSSGALYNNRDGDRQFMYLHFMRYKYVWSSLRLRKVVHIEPGEERNGWQLRLDGFYSVSEYDHVRDRGKGLEVETLVLRI